MSVIWLLLRQWFKHFTTSFYCIDFFLIFWKKYFDEFFYWEIIVLLLFKQKYSYLKYVLIPRMVTWVLWAWHPALSLCLQCWSTPEISLFCQSSSICGLFTFSASQCLGELVAGAGYFWPFSSTWLEQFSSHFLLNKVIINNITTYFLTFFFWGK